MDGIDVVFHQAALRITLCAEMPRRALDVLVDGTYNVLEAAVDASARVVAASSASVLGLAESFPTTEQHHPYNNRTLYGAAKIFNEGLLRSFADMFGLHYIALRYFNVYGPRMDTHGRLHRSIHPLDGADREPASAAHLRRRPSDDGFRACARHRPRQHPRGQVRCHRRGIQRCERNRNEPDRARGALREHHGIDSI